MHHRQNEPSPPPGTITLTLTRALTLAQTLTLALILPLPLPPTRIRTRTRTRTRCELLGALLGLCLRTRSPLPFELSGYAWLQLVGEALSNPNLNPHPSPSPNHGCSWWALTLTLGARTASLTSFIADMEGTQLKGQGRAGAQAQPQQRP